jgi:hypothetical protein
MVSNYVWFKLNFLIKLTPVKKVLVKNIRSFSVYLKVTRESQKQLVTLRMFCYFRIWTPKLRVDFCSQAIREPLKDSKKPVWTIPGDPIRSVDPIVFNRIRVEFHRKPTSFIEKPIGSDMVFVGFLSVGIRPRFHRNLTESDEIRVGSGRISSRDVGFR